MRIVFIGIGGIGLSSLVHIMLDSGISASDIIGIDSSLEQQAIIDISTRGISLYTHGEFVCAAHDIVLYSDAVIHSPEFQFYKDQGARMYSYFHFLGQLSKYFTTIAITGSHGKSTTTAIAISACHTLLPEFALGIVGTFMKEYGGKNYKINEEHKDTVGNAIKNIVFNTGSDEKSPLYFLIEADEFNKHFHWLDTDIALVTNIEHDHTDIYPSKKEYVDAFQYFADRVYHQIIIHPQEKNTLAWPNNTLQTSGQKFQFLYLFGDHNQANANLVFTLLTQVLHCDETKAYEAICGFQGIRRRQEIIYQGSRGYVLSDYAHHPSEVLATYQAVRGHFKNIKTIGIFQPHQAARVLEFEHEFIESLQGFDELFIYPIYTARENFDALAAQYPQLAQAGSFEAYGKQFAQHCGGNYVTEENIGSVVDQHKDDSVIVIMTAGNLDWLIRKQLS